LFEKCTHPASARAVANPAPNPEAPPVMRTFWPFNPEISTDRLKSAFDVVLGVKVMSGRPDLRFADNGRYADERLRYDNCGFLD
jgi:hypothetical protein